MRIELIQPHEHGGRKYPPGSVLEVPKDTADWLNGLKVSKPAPAEKPAPNGESK